MPKVTEAQLTIKGKSGNSYSFDIYTLETNFNKVGAVYAFTHRYQNKEDKFHHTFIYIGRTDDLSTRFNDHHKWDCIKANNANCICIFRIDSEKDRITVEEDLLLGNKTSCNDHLQ